MLRSHTRFAALHIPHAEPGDLHAVCEVCMNFSPTIEPAPPHGILVDLSGSQLPDLSLLQSQAITACQKNVLVSMASTRWVARCAVAYLQRESAGNSLPKPLVIANDREREFLAPLSVRYLTESEMEDAEKLIERLLDLGIHTFDELANVPLGDLTAQFGTDKGPVLHRLATGVDPRTVRRLYPSRQVMAIFSVAPDSPGILNAYAVDQVLIHLSNELAADLSRQGLAARRIRLEIICRKDTWQISCFLRQPACQQENLLEVARRLWSSVSVKDSVLELRLYGENLERPRIEQAAIFNVQTSADSELTDVMRTLQNRFGVQALQKANQLPLSRRELVRSMWERERL